MFFTDGMHKRYNVETNPRNVEIVFWNCLWDQITWLWEFDSACWEMSNCLWMHCSAHWAQMKQTRHEGSIVHGNLLSLHAQSSFFKDMKPQSSLERRQIQKTEEIPTFSLSLHCALWVHRSEQILPSWILKVRKIRTLQRSLQYAF